MPVSENQLLEVLKKAFDGPQSHFTVRDDSDGCGAKFTLLVVSNKFEGVPLLERQRKVNAAIGDLMKQIHAVSMKTWTPEQYEKRKGEL